MPYPSTPAGDALSPQDRAYADRLWDSGQRREAFEFADNQWQYTRARDEQEQRREEQEAREYQQYVAEEPEAEEIPEYPTE